MGAQLNMLLCVVLLMGQMCLCSGGRGDRRRGNRPKGGENNGTRMPDDDDDDDLIQILLPTFFVSLTVIIGLFTAIYVIFLCWSSRKQKRFILQQLASSNRNRDISRQSTQEEVALNDGFTNVLNNQNQGAGTLSPFSESEVLSTWPNIVMAGEKDVIQTTEGDGYAVITDDLTMADQESGYKLITSPANGFQATSSERNPYFVLEETDIEGLKQETDGYEYDPEYQEPFIEPATKEEELFVQIVELKIANIPEEDVEILECLGSGQFGTVNRAKLKQKDENGADVISEVAVKSLTEMSSDEDKIKFLQEAAIMGQFHHCNILKIQGIIMDGGGLKIVADLMHNGDLRHYLTTLRSPNICYQLCEIKQMLMSFTRQVGCGLGYLSFREYVHRDLAARNILVSADGICKIADFGLSRDLQHENYYRSHGGKIPVKWTAPEAINYHKYSTASDVWSYGCLLYEIWSLGEKPYRHLTNAETMRSISNGYRLAPPPGCPKPIYKIMIDCWNPLPESRPMILCILSGLQRPDFIYVKWSPEEMNLYSEESRTLGMELDKGQCLHRDLQRMYFTPSNDSSVKTGNMVREAVKVDKGSIHNDTVVKEEGNKGQLEERTEEQPQTAAHNEDI